MCAQLTEGCDNKWVITMLGVNIHIFYNFRTKFELAIYVTSINDDEESITLATYHLYDSLKFFKLYTKHQFTFCKDQLH